MIPPIGPGMKPARSGVMELATHATLPISTATKGRAVPAVTRAMQTEQ